MPDIRSTALYRFLTVNDAVYSAKLRELREAASTWLSYISSTFPHYTDHSAAHSDEIVVQLSHLIFRDDDPEQPIVPLAQVEAYVLAASAYLHDAGMVVSDSAKAHILTSDEWQAWIDRSAGAQEGLATIAALRASGEPPDAPLREFLANVQLRYLIADFVRRVHHMRVTPILAEHQATLGRFAFDDSLLLQTIADVCVGHGLPHAELDDAHRFPDRRALRGESVNVRLLAILLRLADLLDLRHKRACPLMAMAVAPLPPESVAHWTQYQAIRHLGVAPDAIEIDAECSSAEEHRLLQDWCQWIVNEVSRAPVLMAGSRRHTGWVPPVAKLDGHGATITIRPAPGATYVPATWTFDLDQEAVITRLVESVSPEPLLFLRELVQNALDAMRCALIDELRDHNIETDPAEAPADWRARFPLHIDVFEESLSTSSGAAERFDIVRIRDSGVGMSRDTIERYFLQIGRSYYETPAFRRTYSFTPTSRFGVGFLSVFRDSDYVEVETATAEDVHAGTGGLRLTLNGPRNYIVTEHAARDTRGTDIRVRLRQPLEPGVVTELLTGLCRRVEFPIYIDDRGERTVLEAEGPEQFTWEIEEPPGSGDGAAVRAFPVAGEGVRGEIYVVARRKGGQESWADERWLSQTYPVRHPHRPLPDFPDSLVAVNGLAVSVGSMRTGLRGFLPRGSLRQRVDYRKAILDLGLARVAPSDAYAREAADPVVHSTWVAALAEHLATSPFAEGSDAWVYRNRVMDAFPIGEWWIEQDDIVPAYRQGRRDVCRLAAVRDVPTVSVLIYVGEQRPGPADPLTTPQRITAKQATRDDQAIVIPEWDVNRMASYARTILFRERYISTTRAIGKRLLALDWCRGAPAQSTYKVRHIREGMLAPLNDDDTIGFIAHRAGDGEMPVAILNARSAFVQMVGQNHQRGFGGVRDGVR